MLHDTSSSDLQYRYLKARKAVAPAAKTSKKRSLEEFRSRLDFNYSPANKVFLGTIRRLCGKNTTSIKDLTGNIHAKG